MLEKAMILERFRVGEATVMRPVADIQKKTIIRSMGRGAQGFTLIEVLIALAIFLGAMMAILGLYMQNLRLAMMAREEIIVSMLQRDIMARNQVVAAARAGQERQWRRGVKDASGISVTQPAVFEKFGSPRDGITGLIAPLAADETDDPTQAFSKGWGIRNKVLWEKISGLNWGTSNPPDPAKDTPLYNGFFFIAHPLWRYVPVETRPWVRDTAFVPAGGAEWVIGTTSGLPGLALEDSQFTDWDGYDMVDMDGDGIPETDRGVPYPSPGPIHNGIPAAFPAGSNTYVNNPYRIFFLSDKMAAYYMRVRVRIMWGQVESYDDVYILTDAQVKTREDASEDARVYSHCEYFFSIFNPDIVARWQP
jgi:prepilin-type N-terminal cleavage/methylation domain-containing protein